MMKLKSQTFTLLLLAWLASTMYAVPRQSRRPQPPPPAAASRPYYPATGDVWERRTPQDAGMDAALLKDAVAFAVANESKSPRVLELAHYQSFGREPFGEPVGPFAKRGDPTGIILRGGYIVAEWGEPH